MCLCNVLNFYMWFYASAFKMLMFYSCCVCVIHIFRYVKRCTTFGFNGGPAIHCGCGCDGRDRGHGSGTGSWSGVANEICPPAVSEMEEQEERKKKNEEHDEV